MEKRPVALVREAVRRSRSPFHGDVLGLLRELEAGLGGSIDEVSREALLGKVQALALLVRAHDVGVSTESRHRGMRTLRTTIAVPEDMLLDASYSHDAIATMGERAKEMTIRELEKIRDELRKTAQP